MDDPSQRWPFVGRERELAAFDGLLGWTRRSTSINLNGILAIIVLLPIATVVFARRR